MRKKNCQKSTYQKNNFLFAGTVEIELGCRYQWCLEIPKVTMYQFFIGYFITVMSYPFSMALTSALYAGILGNIPQV